MRIALSCLCFVSFTAGCGGEPAVPAGACTTSRDCGTGEVCLDGACVASPTRDGGTGCGADCECASDAECASSVAACVEAACLEGSCFFRARDERCVEGTCDISAGCTGAADGGELADASVELDGSIVDASVSDASVLDASVSDGGAPDGGGFIVRRDSGVARPVGSACTDASQCAAPTLTSTALCLAPDGTPPMPGGYCSASCSTLTTGTCGRDALCDRIGTLRSGRCLDLCTTDADCRVRDGYSCQRPSSSLSLERVCMPSTAL